LHFTAVKINTNGHMKVAALLLGLVPLGVLFTALNKKWKKAQHKESAVLNSYGVPTIQVVGDADSIKSAGGDDSPDPPSSSAEVIDPPPSAIAGPSRMGSVARRRGTHTAQLSDSDDPSPRGRIDVHKGTGMLSPVQPHFI
jgi:hypothetical protein